MADLSRVWLEGEVFERDLPRCGSGAGHRRVPGAPGANRAGRITYIYPTVNPETRTPDPRGAPEPERALKPGMYATIRFTAPRTAVLSVPRSAVLATGERNFVFVRARRPFVPRDVTSGRHRRSRRDPGGLARRRHGGRVGHLPGGCRVESRDRAGRHGQHARHGRTAPSTGRDEPATGSPASLRATPGGQRCSTDHRLVGPQPADRRLFTAAAAGGIFAVRRTPLEALPDLSDVQVIVQADFNEQAPRIVEDQVTYPIAAEMLKVPGARNGARLLVLRRVVRLRHLRGRHRSLLGPHPRARVPERHQGEAPPTVTPTLGPDATGLGWVYQYALEDTTGTLELAELRGVQDWYLRYALTAVPGVSEVASLGGFEKQYQIDIDPARQLATASDDAG